MLVGRGGRITTPAYSSTVARDSDLAQYETGEGPCLGAMQEHATLIIDDLENEQRWPEYRQGASCSRWHGPVGIRVREPVRDRCIEVDVDRGRRWIGETLFAQVLTTGTSMPAVLAAETVRILRVVRCHASRSTSTPPSRRGWCCGCSTRR